MKENNKKEDLDFKDNNLRTDKFTDLNKTVEDKDLVVKNEPIKNKKDAMEDRMLNKKELTKDMKTEEFEFLMLKTPEDVISALSNFESLDINQKKIVLLSAMFLLDFEVDLDSVLGILSGEEITKIYNEIKDVESYNPNGTYGVEFSLTAHNKACIRLAGKHVGSIMSIPIKSETLFINLDSIELSDLISIAKKGSNLWRVSDKFTYAPKQRRAFYHSVASKLNEMKKSENMTR